MFKVSLSSDDIHRDYLKTYAVGFNNSAYFSTVFRKHTELSPKEYQQQCQLKSSMRAAK
ncbi:AraC family transcriptional regulator [Pseudoalteromonas fuliginea]|uniref:AraC family transcriptional regulator n=1 Tax=Pseudoalteromonas fuliginea TaxID=1872678 RepID=UPI001FD17C6C|nr:AraC family transcriptional regulator [Pseudoalteromonas fuliginea]